MDISALPVGVLLYSELNILSFVIMLIIAVSALRADEFVSHKTELFSASVLCAAVANIFDFFWNIGTTNFWSLPNDVRWTVNFFYFITYSLSSYLWFLYTQTVFHKQRLPKRYYTVGALPMAILAALQVMSLFNGCIFYFDSNGTYHRGSLFFMQYLLSYGYVFAASIICVARALSSDNYDRKNELLAMASFVIPPLLCGLAQLYLQNIPILSVGIVVSFLLAFINSLESLISNDELTDIPTRREMLRCLSAEVKAFKPDDKLYFMFIDIDGFKKTNDTYGHAEGDRALKVLAKVLEHICDETAGFCARYGGDEFTYLVRCGSDDEPEHIQRRIKILAEQKSIEASLKTPIKVSIGCAKYRPEMSSIQQLIAEADVDMYNAKKQKGYN